MKRQLCVTALFAVVLIPDWASACWPMWGGPVYTRTYSAPSYREPIYYPPPPVCCPPISARPGYVVPGAVPVPMPPPRIVPGRASGEGSRTDPGRGIVPNAGPPEPVRPAVGVQGPKPEPAPAPVEPKRGPLDAPTTRIPDPDPASKPPTWTPVPDPASKPPLERPGGSPMLPSLDPPKIGAEPKLPPLELPGGSATPVPAPSPDLLIPSPGVPTVKNPDALPPLTLPPESPVAPEKATKGVEAKSSPLTTGARDLQVSVFPATGAGTATGLRKIGFYNHTKRDLALTVEGKTVTLPALSYLHAQLPPTFTWACSDKAAATETVPAGSAGLDVLIRE